MKYELLVPRINTNDDEVDVVHWYVQDKEYVEKGKEILDLESSKAVVSIESEAAGYILCHSQKGDSVRVGVPLATFYSDLQELEADLKGSNSQIKGDSLGQQKEASNEFSGEQLAIEKIDTSTVASQPIHKSQTSALVEGASNQSPFGFTRFSKAAQDYMGKNSIDPKRFEGMGLVSVDVIEDILGIRQLPNSTTLQGNVEYQNRQKSPYPSITNPELRSEKVGKSKKLEIQLLTAGQAGGINSSLTVQFDSVGIRQTLAELDSLNGQILPLILFELARLLEEYSAFTSYYEDGKIYYYDRVDIGLAIDLGKGLKVPVIRNANQLSPSELLELITDFATGYLENKLSVEDLTGGTITISDLSSEDILHFQPLINQNQSVILGIGGDSSIDGHPMTLTLVFDHRILAGREVALFLNDLKNRLLSYQLANLPETENAVQSQNINCSRCLIDINSLYRDFGRDALMYVHVDDTGQTTYICHSCVGGL